MCILTIFLKSQFHYNFSWHVRTKDNIARVRRDEAQAAEEEKELERRIKLAEQEARMSLLRNMAADRMTSEQTSELQKLSGQTAPVVVAGPSARLLERPSACSNEIQTQNNQHVNFFSELEAGKYINFIRRGEGGCKIGHFYICINFENEKFLLILLFTQNFVKLYFQEKLVLRLKTRKEKLKKRKNKKNTKRKWEF